MRELLLITKTTNDACFVLSPEIVFNKIQGTPMELTAHRKTSKPKFQETCHSHDSAFTGAPLTSAHLAS